MGTGRAFHKTIDKTLNWVLKCNFICNGWKLRRPRGDIGRKKMWLSRTYAIMIRYVRNHDPVHTQSLSRMYFKLLYFIDLMCSYISRDFICLSAGFEFREASKGRGGGSLTRSMYILRSDQLCLWQVSSLHVGGNRYGDICLSITDLPIIKLLKFIPDS